MVPRSYFVPEASWLQGLFVFRKKEEPMMKHISVTDTTIRQAGKAAGYTLSFREKIELAKLLDRSN